MRSIILFLLAACSGIAFSQTPTPSPKPDDTLIQAVKAQNAKAVQMNAIITAYNVAAVSKDWPAAAAAVKQLIDLESRPEYYLALGNAQLNAGKYDDSIAAYGNFLKLAGYPVGLKTADAKSKESFGIALTNTGNAYLKLKRISEAVKNYELAAEISPNPGLAYFNLCATQYNMGDMDAAVTSCGKAIAADPTRADAYFIKGSALFGSGKLDANGKYVLPPGTREALKKYVELAPNGPHAADVRQMLETAIP